MNWSRGLDPVTIHRQKSPNCSVLHIILEVRHNIKAPNPFRSRNASSDRSLGL